MPTENREEVEANTAETQSIFGRVEKLEAEYQVQSQAREEKYKAALEERYKPSLVNLERLPPFGPKSPYLTMLFRPRETIRELLNGPYKNCNLTPLIFLPAVLSVVFLLFSIFSPVLKDTTNKFRSEIILNGAVLLFTIALPTMLAVFSVIHFYCSCFLTTLITRMCFSPYGDYRDTRFAYAWSLMPNILHVIFLLILGVFLTAYFMLTGNLLMQVDVLSSFQQVLGWVFIAWGFIVRVIAIAEANDIAIWKSTVAVLITIALMRLIVSLI